MRSRQSDPSAHQVFEILVYEHADMLTAFLRSIVAKPEIVDDLFQETMIVAWRRLNDYDRSQPMGPWLRGIAKRLVLQHQRQAAHDLLNCDPAVLEALENRMFIFEQIPADSFRDKLRGLRKCLDKLPELARDVITLGYGRGMLLRDIASALNASEEAIKKRMQRARVLLMKCLGV